MSRSDLAVNQRVRVSGSVLDFSGRGVAVGVIEHIEIIKGGPRYMVQFPNGQWYYFGADELVEVQE